MNLQTQLHPNLWRAISSTYEAGNYSHAILDAIHYLSDVIREKSGLGGDGATLVGQALGGNNPKLKLNKLQTDSERNEQAGYQDILRGIYRGIRNPRSHEQIEDTQDTANAVILFINYLLTILEESEESFTIDKFLDRVFDDDFVETLKYSELLVNQIPVKKQLDTLIEIYRNKQRGDGIKLSYIVNTIIDKLSPEDLDEFLVVVSEELQATSDLATIKYNLQVLKPELWLKINDISRLRIENKLLKIIQNGKYIWQLEEIIGDSWLGTWSRDFLQYFDSKHKVSLIFLQKLRKDNESISYVANFFLSTIPIIAWDGHIGQFVNAIVDAIKDNHPIMRQRFQSAIWSFPDDWRTNFAALLEDVQNDDGSPFFSNNVDDIPF